MAPKQHQPWQVDRHIPLALIFSIAVLFVAQTVAGAMWVASVSGRIDTLEKRVEGQALVIGPLVERSIRLETRLENLIDGQARMENILRNSILSYSPPSLTGAPANPPRPALVR